MRTTLKSILLRIAVSFLSSSGALELLSSFVFVIQEYYLIRNMRICLILILFSPFFPYRTTEDIAVKYPREPEMRYNSTLTSPVSKEVCSTSPPRVSKYGKELHHLLALPAKEKRGYFLHRKHCLIFADDSNCIQGN